MFVIVTTKC